VARGALEGTWEGEVVEHRAVPRYPADLQAQGIGGVVRVRVLVDASGSPLQACGEEGPALLQVASEQAALRFKFKPMLLNGKPVPLVVHHVVFKYVPSRDGSS
jgi:TonB family protein